jgi:hypothetical protein
MSESHSSSEPGTSPPTTRRVATDRRPSPTSPSVTRHAEISASLTETIHEKLDPSPLPPKIQSLLDELGPYLTAGLGYSEIAERLQPHRSTDWVATRVGEIRRAIAANVLEGDELPAELRADLEDFAAGRTPRSRR